MDDLIRKLRKQAGHLAAEHRVKFGGTVLDRHRERYLEWRAANALEQLQTDHDELRKLYTEVSDRAYKRLSQLRDAEDRIEQLEFENQGMRLVLAEQGVTMDHCDIVATRKLEVSLVARDGSSSTQWSYLLPDIPGHYWWRPRKEVEPTVVDLVEGGKFAQCGDWQCPADHGCPGEWWPERLQEP